MLTVVSNLAIDFEEKHFYFFNQAKEAWPIDFMRNKLSGGRSFRTFNVIDDYNRVGLGIEAAPSLPSVRVIHSLEHIIE